MSPPTPITDDDLPTPRATRRRALVMACAAHALHDGYTDLIYVLLPVWQTEFALGYGMLALVRGANAGAMACLQIPAGWLATRVGGRGLLALGTVIAALGYALAGVSGGLLGLCAALALSGAGSSTQHPIGSAIVSRAYGRTARGPLGTFNFAGDLGKAAIPAATSLLLTHLPWRGTLWVLAALGAVMAAAIFLFMPATGTVKSGEQVGTKSEPAGGGRSGFSLLLLIGILDTGVRMGLLTLLPFLLRARGASLPMVGLALALTFIGGAAGKFACGWLGGRVGMLWAVILTEGGTAIGILALLGAPLAAALILLPFLGILLNGTSSVLYGTVPELAPPEGAEKAFAIFYTAVIGSSTVAPVFYGILGDWVGVPPAIAATAITALATIPLAVALAPRLGRGGERIPAPARHRLIRRRASSRKGKWSAKVTHLRQRLNHNRNHQANRERTGNASTGRIGVLMPSGRCIA